MLTKQKKELYIIVSTNKEYLGSCLLNDDNKTLKEINGYNRNILRKDNLSRVKYYKSKLAIFYNYILATKFANKMKTEYSYHNWLVVSLENIIDIYNIDLYEYLFIEQLE